MGCSRRSPGESPRVSWGHQNEVTQAVPREDQSGASQGLSGAVGVFMVSPRFGGDRIGGDLWWSPLFYPSPRYGGDAVRGSDRGSDRGSGPWLWSVAPIMLPILGLIGEPPPKSDECITDLDQTGAVLYILEGVGLRSVILW